MIRVERIDVTGFRGIVRTSFELRGGSLVLGGGNGTGKSALVDAIELLYTGSVSTLSGTAGLSLSRHGAHIDAERGSTSVEATYSHPSGTIRRRLGGEVDASEALRAHLDRGSKIAFILRRGQLQDFIHAKPADRYRTLADLIRAGEVERMESALKRARDTVQRELVALTDERKGIDTRLQALPNERSDEDLLREANVAIVAAGLPDLVLQSFEDIGPRRGEALRRVRQERLDPGTKSRVRLVAALDRGIGQERMRDALAEYVSSVPGGKGSSADASMLDLLQLLRRSRDYIRTEEVRDCPVCGQEVDARSLLSRLMRRVGQLEEVSLQQQRLDRSREAVETAIQDAGLRLREIERLQPEAKIPGNETRLLQNSLSMLTESLRGRSLVETMEMVHRTEDALESWIAWRRDTIEHATKSEHSTETDEPDPYAALLSILQDVASRRARSQRGQAERERLAEEWDAVTVRLKEKERALVLVEKVYTGFLGARNIEIQMLFDALRDDLIRYYDYLHPGEGHRALSIAMDPRKRGSSDLRMGFYARGDEDPRAFASEGHLDSLGLCIFLAFARHFNEDWPLLVLDDVVSSVDAAHKRRVAQLLFREFADRQLVITTHDSRWFTDLGKAEEETAKTGTTTNMIIEAWSREEGPRLKVIP